MGDEIFDRKYLTCEFDPCIEVPSWSQLSRYLAEFGTFAIADPTPGVADEDLPIDVLRAIKDLGFQVSRRGELVKVYRHEEALWGELILVAPWLISAQFFDADGNQIEIADASSIIVHADGESLSRMIGPDVAGWQAR